MAELKSVGKRAIRRDAREKVTGEGRFTTDVYLPGMLHAKVLRSNLPHARIKAIDTSKAEALQGVRAVLTYKNTIDTLYNAAAALMEIPPGETLVMDQRILDNVVRYVGDEVAAVAADTVEIANEALKLIEVEYEELPYVLDPIEAEKPDSISIHPDKPQYQSAHNISGWPAKMGKGDVEKGFAEADEIVEVSFKIAPVKQMQMETHGAVAQVEDDRVTVWSTTQNVQVTRGQLAHIFNIPMSRMTVKNPPYVGGGFGIRIGLSGKAEVIAVALALATKKPVKYIYTRHEDLIASDTRHGGYVWAKLGSKKDGTFTALDLKCVLNKGAYTSHGPGIVGTLGVMNTSLYRIPNIRFYGYAVYTNMTMGGAMRGYGNPQGNMTVNRAVDMMAEKLGMDPLDLRRKNATRKGDEYMQPYPNDSSTLDGCMVLGAEKISWSKRADYNKQNGKYRRGLGMSIGTHFSGGHPYVLDYENAIITVQADGSFNVATPASDIGTGCNTSLAQIAADALSVPFESVHLIYADSSATPYGYGSHSSRSAYMHGNAILAASVDTRKKILEYAAGLCGKSPEDFEMIDGVVRSRDGSKCFPFEILKMAIFPGHAATQVSEEGPQASITIAELAHYAHSKNHQIVGVGQVDNINAPPWYCAFADVSIDTETGKITLNKMVGVHDVGRVVNPDCVEGQITGGNLQGIGYIMSEELPYNASNGQQYVHDIHQYMQPTSLTAPDLEAFTVEEDCPSGPFGAKGLGETPNIASGAAVVNAIYNALGKSPAEIDVPITPERILDILEG